MGGTLGKKLDKPLSASPDSSVQKSLAERKPLQKIPLKQFLQVLFDDDSPASNDACIHLIIFREMPRPRTCL